VRGSEEFQFATPLWICPRLAELTVAEFWVRYHAGHVWKLLEGLGFSCQRPVGRVVERDEAVILVWKHKQWPAIERCLPGRVHDRLHRRKRSEPAVASGPDLGASGLDADVRRRSCRTA
jgi:hypothetical protein